MLCCACQGTGYVDAGVVCQDQEDGLITSLRPDVDQNEPLGVEDQMQISQYGWDFIISFKPRILTPLRVFTSDASSATARAVVDGVVDAGCGNCEVVTAGGGLPGRRP